MKIAFLGCAETLPGSPRRRPDAFEHDLQFESLAEGLAGSATELFAIDWRAPLARFEGTTIALIGSAWDYTEKTAEFLDRLEDFEAMGILVCNPSAMVRWNADKGYLNELEQRGAATIPTLWHDNPGRDEVLKALEQFGCQSVVVKRRVGAGALGQFSFDHHRLPEPGWRMGQAALIQPLLSAIRDEGEYSFVFLDGEFSHAILKRAAPGDYRIQSLYGGTESEVRPQLGDIKTAAEIVAAIPFDTPLYARIDMVRAPEGHLALIEAELIEPYLYPVQRRDFGKALARAVLARGTGVTLASR